MSLFLALAAPVLLVTITLAVVWPVAGIRTLIILAGILAVAQAWHELSLRLSTASLDPGNYAKQLGAKSLLAILIGGLLAWMGWGAKAPVAALILGSLLGWWLFSRKVWSGVNPKWPEEDALHSYRSYGLPLAITFALVWVTSSADRIIIGWLLGVSSVGQYAVGYDLAQHSLGLLLTIVNTAAMPLVIRLLEKEGESAASCQMKHNGELLFALAMAGAAGMIAIGPLIIELFVGRDFRAGALEVFPWIALTAAVIGIKSFHFDIAFHLSKQSRWLVVTSGSAALMSVLLNFLLIPRYGIVGAAWASLVGFSLATIASALLGTRVFPMPRALPMLAKGLLVAVPTWLTAWLVAGLDCSPVIALGLSILAGAATALMVSLAFDVAGMRQAVASNRRK
jgi:O-antigen/teichoic acid export membrane protein